MGQPGGRGRGGGGGGATGGPPRGLRRRVRGAHEPRRRGGLALEHRRVAVLSAAGAAGGPDGAPDLRGQRREGTGARRRVGRRGGRPRRLHRHGRLDGRGRRHRARRPAARRPARQRGPHRPRRRRPRRSSLPVRQPWLSGSGSVGHGTRGPDRTTGAAGPTGMGGAHRHARRPGHLVGGRPARPLVGRGERIGGAGFRRALLPEGPGGDGCGLPHCVRPGARVVPGGLGDGGPLVGAARVGLRGVGVGA